MVENDVEFQAFVKKEFAQLNTKIDTKFDELNERMSRLEKFVKKSE